MPRVQFLSEYNLGSSMGMGHYERLLISSLMSESSRDEWQFGFTCAGRVDKGKLEVQHPDFESRDSFGVSNRRFMDWPYPVVRSLTNARFSRIGHFLGGCPHKFKKPRLYHSFALNLAAPTSGPSIYTIHDLPPLRFSDEGRLSSWARSAARNASLILTPSEFAKREIVELLGVDEKRIAVVPNGCETEWFNLDVPVASKDTLKRLGIETPFLIYVGGSSQRKNVSALLEAWRIVAPHHPEMQLVLAGPDSLGKMIHDQQVPGALAVGYLSREVLPSVMRAARALVCPSIYEGFGLPPLESLAMGVPVIASRTGGATPEVVGNAGVLARDGSAEALAEAIETLINAPELEARLRKAGPERAKKFSWAQHARTVLRLYKSVIES